VVAAVVFIVLPNITENFSHAVVDDLYCSQIFFCVFCKFLHIYAYVVFITVFSLCTFFQCPRRRFSKQKEQYMIKIINFIGRPFVKRFALSYRTVVLSACLSCLSVMLVYCGQTVGRIKMKLGVEVGLGLCQIVFNGDPAPLAQRATAPKFLAMFVVAKRLDGSRCKLGTEVGLGPGHTVLNGDPAPLPQKGTTPNFRPNACCGETAGWIKIPLGREVSLGPGHIVLDGDSAPPNFCPCLLWPNGRLSQLLLSTFLIFRILIIHFYNQICFSSKFIHLTTLDVFCYSNSWIFTPAFSRFSNLPDSADVAYLSLVVNCSICYCSSC